MENHIRTADHFYCPEGRSRLYSYPPPNSGGYATPWLWYDGDPHGSYVYTQWEAKIVARMAQPAPVTITIWGHYVAEDDTGRIYAQVRNDSTDFLQGNVPFIITEDSLYYVALNGDVWHNHVSRDYIPNHIGVYVSIPAGDSVIVNQPLYLDTAWDWSMCQIKTFFQCDRPEPDSTLEVWQGAILHVTDLTFADFIPPASPLVTAAEKIGDNLRLYWNTVTEDTSGAPEDMGRYVVYRNTSPDFIPATPDSIGGVAHPDTEYTDTGALAGATSYYYLIKAVDAASNQGKKSNMAFAFRKPMNENPVATDENRTMSGDWLINVTNMHDE